MSDIDPVPERDEITPAMIDAGVAAYLSWLKEENPYLRELVAAVYRSMAAEA